MGTNFYMWTAKKSVAEEYAPFSYEDTDASMPKGYWIHIAKTSSGWLPLFQAHTDGINSVKGYLAAFKNPAIKIYDEYLEEYTEEDFIERVIKHNGGVRGAIPITEVYLDYMDLDMPNHVPVSHFEYGNGKYCDDYFVDVDGYEFSRSNFC